MVSTRAMLAWTILVPLVCVRLGPRRIVLDEGVPQCDVQNLLREAGIERIPNAGRGECFFHAVSQQISFTNAEIRAIASACSASGEVKHDMTQSDLVNLAIEGEWTSDEQASATAQALGESIVLLNGDAGTVEWLWPSGDRDFITAGEYLLRRGLTHLGFNHIALHYAASHFEAVIAGADGCTNLESVVDDGAAVYNFASVKSIVDELFAREGVLDNS